MLFIAQLKNFRLNVTEFFCLRCWSYVGDYKVGQNLSIGAGCDTKAIVEHELLHALGFYHEQSRSDRDDYVQIMWDQITEGEPQLLHQNPLMRKLILQFFVFNVLI